MGVLVAVVAVVFFAALVWGVSRLNTDSTKRMTAPADDIRRADDGRPDQPFIDYGNPMG